MSEATSILRAENLHRHLGQGEARAHVLRGVSLELKPGKLYAVAGPSGCGKSTLLYLLGLLDRQDDGEIWIGGERMSAASDAERTAARNRLLGFVFQFHFLLPEFTALENVMLPMRKHGRLGNAPMRQHAQALLDEVGLGGKAQRLATQLSGGEQQRVAIARALANDPTLLLADEPTGNLDQQNSSHVFELLTELAHKKGHTVLLVTHNPELANRADAILRMQDGKFVN
ncbi:MAG TPA: ABC transporter ATP-binding protein [Opitutales bacterium]|nr:ABC transporter ATP-binding protein [Opitutales bacterium]